MRALGVAVAALVLSVAILPVHAQADLFEGEELLLAPETAVDCPSYASLGPSSSSKWHGICEVCSTRTSSQVRSRASTAIVCVSIAPLGIGSARWMLDQRPSPRRVMPSRSSAPVPGSGTTL